jgi:hypothetical protein
VAVAQLKSNNIPAEKKWKAGTEPLTGGEFIENNPDS